MRKFYFILLYDYITSCITLLLDFWFSILIINSNTMQQKSQPPYMTHKPFKILFGLTLLASFIFGGYIVLAGSCQDSCVLQDGDRYFDCYVDDIHYCCSIYSIYGPTSCEFFTDCAEISGTCDRYFIGMIVSGSIAMILMISMIVVGVQFSKKHNAMMEAAYQNMHNNQGYIQG